MGIPSYFSYIVRKHASIIKRLETLPRVHNLYMDCNSIIYESVRKCGPIGNTSPDYYETELIQDVCRSIESYIRLIEPTNKVLLAFDGVAPVAKLNQQRERRYKSWFTSVIEKQIEEKTREKNGVSKAHATIISDQNRGWNTTAITPGTKFMQKLSEMIHVYFSRVSTLSPLSEPVFAEITRQGIHDNDNDNDNDTQIEEPNATKTTLIMQYKPAEIIITTSNKAGEGEHKIFEYIRTNPEYHAKTDTMIYGLDADLIMLTLNHLHISERLYLYRDTPEFIHSLNSELSSNENYYLDIPQFAKYLDKEMRVMTMRKDVEEEAAILKQPLYEKPLITSSAVDDYILMCFFLGNDFMPHFPSLNLRTHGLDILLQTYVALFQNTTEYLTRRNMATMEKTIVWKNVKKFISALARIEHDQFMAEHKQRDKQSKGMSSIYGYNEKGGKMSEGTNRRNVVVMAKSTPTHGSSHLSQPLEDESQIESMVADNIKQFNSIPILDRSVERYIDPFTRNWEYRYYDALFDITFDERWGRDICTNYLEGLEWTFKYYSGACIDWRWCYKYAYAPLLTDLVKYVPSTDINMLPVKPKSPINEIIQLCYVLPLASHHLLPANVSRKIHTNCMHYYEENLEFKWAYCRYFWEAHTDLPMIHIPDLERILSLSDEQVQDIAKTNVLHSVKKSTPKPITGKMNKKIQPSLIQE
jgi:5'-3' exoribonuclease 2